RLKGLYEQYSAMISRRCVFLLKDEDRAFDALQEVFMRLLKNPHYLKGSQFSSLLYTMATNVCLNFIRDQNRKRENAGDNLIDKLAMLPAPADDLESRDFFHRFFATQKDSTRLMAVMHFLDGMTHEAIAEEFHMSISGVRKRLRHLQADLKTYAREAL
ncbi:MAG: sigma-70 family RNA polymerase sigma factor, partial [Spirochaetia bacterium]|nr:sigma-70 family RNA polymerase sigma factor [Spirochaetia bacterium]